jgi:microcystin-dependent protein
MKHLFTISLCFLALSLSAQETITYPYNPDGNADGSITVPDLQDFLGNYGGAFSPSDILVDGETLVTVLTNLQNSIDSLSALTGGSAGSVLDMPIGTVLPVASEAVPEGWMLCDGSEVGIEDYQALYDLVGTTYGAGDSAFWAQVNYPATTFNIPDLRGRTIIGADNMGGESAGVVSQHPSWLGKSGGAEMHQLTVEEMASLSSYIGQPLASYYGPNVPSYLRVLMTSSSYFGGSGYPQPYWQSLHTDAGDQPHNNMQPYIALNYMVKVKAAFDVIEEMQSQIEALQDEINTLQLQNQWPSVVNGHLIISNANLSNANLSNANLSYANLSNANLNNTDLSFTNLSNADLTYAFLYGANLSNADLSGAYLFNANLSYANLSNANLSGAYFPGVTWLGAYIEGCTGCDCVDANGDNYCD